MGLGCKCSVLQSVKNNDLIAPEDLENHRESETKLKSNGACHVEHVDDKLLVDKKSKGTVGMSTPETALTPEGMGWLSPAATKRRGLKKWLRMPRELVKKASNNLDSKTNGDLTVLSSEMEQGSDASISLLNDMVNVIGNASVHSLLYGDYGLEGQPVFAVVADSVNSEDHSSRSSTAGSAPKVRSEMRNFSGKSSGISVLSGDQQRYGRIGAMKKARGVKIEKQNSHSSLESDSRSSNFVFVQGTNSVADNGRQSSRLANYEKEYGDDAQYGGKHLSEEAQIAFRENEAESEDVSQEDFAAENSWDVKEDNVENHVGSMDQDALVKSLTKLDSVREELDKELQKWRDVGKDDPLIFDDLRVQSSESTSVNPQDDDPMSESRSSCSEPLVQREPNAVHLQGKLEDEVKDARILELESALTCGDTKAGVEDLLKKIIEAEVECVAITTTTENLKAGALHEIKLKVQGWKKEAETREDVKNRMCRYTSYFMIQLILLLVILYMQFFSNNVVVVPT